MITILKESDELFQWLVKLPPLNEMSGIIPVNVNRNELCLRILQELSNDMLVMIDSNNEQLDMFLVCNTQKNIASIYLFYVSETADKRHSDYFNMVKEVLYISGIDTLYFQTTDFRPSFRRWATKLGAKINSVQYKLEI